MNLKNISALSLIIVGAISILATAVIFLGYVSFNASVSLAYARQQQRDEQEQRKVLQDLLFQVGNGLSQEQVIQLIRKNFSAGHIIKEEDNQISVDGVVLKFNDKKLAAVSSLNEQQ